MSNHLARRNLGRSIAGLSLLSFWLCGCPGSPLAELLAERNGLSNQDTTESPVSSGFELPRPRIFASNLAEGVVVIEFGLLEETDKSEVFGFNVYRSVQPDRGFTRTKVRCARGCRSRVCARLGPF